MLESLDAGVGAVGVPVNAGEANGAAPNNVIVWATVKSAGTLEPLALLPLIVRAGILDK